MKKLNFKLKGILFLIFFGVIVINCSLSAQTDRRLNGRWVLEIGEYEYRIEYTFNNGNFETSSGGILSTRGTYTVANGVITINTTHVFGDLYRNYGFSGLESRWYANDEFYIAIRPFFRMQGSSESMIDLFIDGMRETNNSVLNYSVDANTLILTSPDGVGNPSIFKKR